MRKKAKRLGELCRRGALRTEEEAQARKQFIGICRKLLADVLGC